MIPVAEWRPYVCYESKGMINIKYPRDLTGMQFGELTVLGRDAEYIDNNGQIKRDKWVCRCSCGSETIVIRHDLVTGNTKSCGCIKKRKRAKDLTGKTFGRLTVLERVEDHISPCGHKEIMWKCRCECGNEVIVQGKRLRNGTTRSCGCLSRELTSERFSTHGYSKERLYGVWTGMIDRCCNENNQNYHNYGARGIKLCDEWRHNYVSFREWALQAGYDENAEPGECTIDRINTDGNYEPDNCRWANKTEQARNRRNTIMYVYNGEEKPLAEWCDEFDLPYLKVSYRLKHGWTFEEALEL